MSETATYAFIVTTNMAIGPEDTSAVKTVVAAYYQHESDFTVFKDDDGKQVASFSNGHIVSIERRQFEGGSVLPQTPDVEALARQG